MEFFIRQGATDPILKMRLIDDGKNDKSSYNNKLEESASNEFITFEMFDIKTGNPVILNGVCYVTSRTKLYNHVTDEYYIIYRFSEEQTSITGRFEGKFKITFLDSSQSPTIKLIMPIREKLYINVI